MKILIVGEGAVINHGLMKVLCEKLRYFSPVEEEDIIHVNSMEEIKKMNFEVPVAIVDFQESFLNLDSLTELKEKRIEDYLNDCYKVSFSDKKYTENPRVKYKANGELRNNKGRIW